MKKKNGFTLIELLAILVILAIIAVVTVPIILEIIDDAKKGTIQDSAYGYKDAVNKWYAQELLKNKDLKLNGTYNIINGKLNGNNINNSEIPISGSVPSNGYLTYKNNILTSGCLTIDEYAITFENEKIINAEKGECEGSTLVLSCNDDEYLYEEYNYTITDQNACETYFNDDWGCGIDEQCINNVSNYCAGEYKFTIVDDINDGYVEYSDVEDFVSKKITVSSCMPKYGYSIAINGYNSSDSNTISTSRPNGSNIYLRYTLINGEVESETTP